MRYKEYSIIFLISIIVGVSTLSGCSTSSSETNFESKTECDLPGEESSDGKYVCAGRGAFYWIPKTWTVSLGNEDYGIPESQPLFCGGNPSIREGELVSCTFHFSLQNISASALSVSGNLYLEVDGALYEATNPAFMGDPYPTEVNAQNVLPGEFAISKGDQYYFEIPLGGLVERFFIAQGPNGMREVEVNMAQRILFAP
jgi:hypothetical protein